MEHRAGQQTSGVLPVEPTTGLLAVPEGQEKLEHFWMQQILMSFPTIDAALATSVYCVGGVQTKRLQSGLQHSSVVLPQKEKAPSMIL